MITPGTKVIRLNNSSTGRNIIPGDIGVVGGINPQDYNNPPSFGNFDYIPIQWERTQLWSSLGSWDEGFAWNRYVNPTPKGKPTRKRRVVKQPTPKNPIPDEDDGDNFIPFRL